MIHTLFSPSASDPKPHPYLIAGPCSVETPEQLYNSVEALYKMGIRTIRGGIWKPRTRPGSFEGLGEVALPWIGQIKEVFDVEFATEVASALHVEQALKAGVDILWIGARSTANPFTVQEIAKSLQGVQVPVLIKNPVNPDLSLWIGAVERIQGAGIEQVAGIHRGFSNYRDTIHRNSPLWQIPIEFRSHFPELPLICDPSHISGKRELIYGISQKALDLNFDGLMIESHPQPDVAWSDAAQQLNPADLEQLLDKLQSRKLNFEGEKMRETLEEIRVEIDHADQELLEAIQRRMALVEQIGRYKKQNNVAVLDMERWKKILESRPNWAKQLGLNAEMIEEMFVLIHQESIRKQTDMLDKE